MKAWKQDTSVSPSVTKHLESCFVQPSSPLNIYGRKEISNERSKKGKKEKEEKKESSWMKINHVDTWFIVLFYANKDFISI